MGDQHIGKHVLSFSDALEKTKFGKFNYMIILVGSLILLNMSLESYSIAYVLPLAECDLHLTNQLKGLLGSITIVGMIPASYLWGFFADKKGRRTIMIRGLFAGFFCTVLSSFSTTAWLIILLRFSSGVFLAASVATNYAYIGEFHMVATRSRTLMLAHSIYYIGVVLKPALAWVIINQDWSFYIPYLDLTYKPWRLFIVTCGVPGLLSGLLLLLFCPESPKFLLTVGRDEEAIAILQKMHRWNVGKGERLQITGILPEEVITKSNTPKGMNRFRASLRSFWMQTTPLFKGSLLRTSLIIYVAQFVSHTAANGFYVWLPNVAQTTIEFANQYPNNRSLLCELQVASSDKSNGHCIDKLDIKTYINGFVIEGLGAVTLAIITLIITRVKAVYISCSILVMSGICGIVSAFVDTPLVALGLMDLLLVARMSFYVLRTIVVDAYPTHLRAKALSLEQFFCFTGSVAGSNIVGNLIFDYCQATFYISGGVLIFIGSLVLFLPKQIKQ